MMICMDAFILAQSKESVWVEVRAGDRHRVLTSQASVVQYRDGLPCSRLAKAEDMIGGQVGPPGVSPAFVRAIVTGLALRKPSS